MAPNPVSDAIRLDQMRRHLTWFGIWNEDELPIVLASRRFLRSRGVQRTVGTLLKRRQGYFVVASQALVSTMLHLNVNSHNTNNYHSHLTIRTARPLGRSPILRRLLH